MVLCEHSLRFYGSKSSNPHSATAFPASVFSLQVQTQRHMTASCCRFTVSVEVSLPDKRAREDILRTVIAKHCREHALGTQAVDQILQEVWACVSMHEQDTVQELWYVCCGCHALERMIACICMQLRYVLLCNPQVHKAA